MPIGGPTSGQHVRHEDSPKPSYHVAPMSGYGSDPNGENLQQNALFCMVSDCGINPTGASSDMHLLLTHFRTCDVAASPLQLINIC